MQRQIEIKIDDESMLAIGSREIIDGSKKKESTDDTLISIDS